MKIETPLHAERELTQVAARFEHWRQNRTTPSARIPPSLWEQAVALTTVLPRSRVARQLRLSGQALKHRCMAQHAAPSVCPASATASEASRTALDFVEVPAAPVWPRPTTPIEIELHRPDGTRLRIATHETQPSLLALVQTFLETPSCCS